MVHVKVYLSSAVKVFFAIVSDLSVNLSDNLLVKGATVQAKVGVVMFVLHSKVISLHLSVSVEVYTILMQSEDAN